MRRIGILTFHRAVNYGAVLQAYALSAVLQEHLEEGVVQIIDYRCKYIEDAYKPWTPLNGNKIVAIVRAIIKYRIKRIKRQRFDHFLSTSLPLTKQAYCRENIADANAVFDTFITGSDQVFNLRQSGQDLSYLLDFASNSKKLYSYAASVGRVSKYLENESEYLQQFKRFEQVSFRERMPQTEQNDGFYGGWRVDIDPTLLMKREKWLQLATASKHKDPYILIYTMQRPKKLIRFAKELSARTGLKLLYLDDSYVRHIGIEHIRGQSLEEFLGYFAYATYILTTSFHGTVFSLQFRKKFYVELDKTTNRNERVEHLLRILGLLDRAIDQEGTIDTDQEIQWDEIDARIEEKRQESMKYVKNIISENGKLLRT
ncbi:MAG: polysaccharide pyruvyl transferase family protein [Clostridia bacterium]|nr:polysaccharide pyruvyl transferase family protein [Clostridia bacterium]